MTHPSRIPSILRPAHRFPAGTLVLALAFLQACGGGGGGTSATVQQAPPVTNANIAGAWIYTAPSGTVYRDLILPGTLEFRSLDSNMAEGVGTLAVNGNAVTGTITAYPPAAYAAYYPITNGTIAGTATDTSINDTATFPLGPFSASLAPDAPANVSVQLAQLAGTYTADSTHTSSGLGGTLTVNADGTFTLADSSGSGQGSFAQVAANLNAFTTTLTFTPTGGTAADYSGLSYQLTGSPASIVFMTTRSSGELAGIFTKP